MEDGVSRIGLVGVVISDALVLVEQGLTADGGAGVAGGFGALLHGDAFDELERLPRRRHRTGVIVGERLHDVPLVAFAVNQSPGDDRLLAAAARIHERHRVIILFQIHLVVLCSQHHLSAFIGV